MIVDIHTHVFEDPKASPYPRPSDINALLRSMDEHKVDKSIIIPLPGWASNQYVDTPGSP